MTYSIQNPYTTSAGFLWRWGSFPAEVALLGDLAPSVASRDVAGGNSLNHVGAGQMWTRGDGSTQFATTPKIGPNQDHLYLARTDSPTSPLLGQPADNTDATLAIMADRGNRGPVTGLLTVAGITFVGALGLGALFVLRLVSKNRAASPPPPPVMA